MKLQAVRRDLESRAEDQQQRLSYYERRANYTTLGYRMWHRFFYFAVAHTSATLQCAHWPMVLGLSLSCSSVYFLIFLQVFIKLNRIHNLLDIIGKEHAHICQRISKATNQDDEGSSMEAGASIYGVEFNFSFQVRVLNHDSFTVVERKVYTCAMAFALLAVTAFELDACKYLLCH